MRFVAYSSKLWNFGILILILLFGGVFGVFAYAGLPLWGKVAAVLVFGGLIALTVVNLTGDRAAIEIDETGILCYRAYYSRIPWDAVVSAVRAPRSEMVNGPDGNGVRTCFSEAWRPIDLVVLDLNKYATGWLARWYRGALMAIPGVMNPPAYALRIEMCGLAASSEDAMRAIEYYLAQKKSHADRA